MSRIPVSVLGATGVVGQRFVRRLAEHPWFELRHLAASPRSTGLPYGEACVWRIPGPAHGGFGARKVLPCTPDEAFAPLVFSALDADTAREVEPLGVVYYGGAWYLVAWCRLRKDHRHFRVDRIKRLELQPEKFVPRPDFSLARHMAEQADKERAEMVPAQVWFHRRVHEKARRESYATLITGCERDSGAEFTLYTWSFEWLAQWLLSFGDAAEALNPPELRAAVREQARRIIEKHRS